VHNVLHCTAEDWKLPLVRKLGHVYLEWSATDRILYTKSELQKLHRYFSHSSTQNHFALLKRAKADDLDASTRAVLTDIQNSCSTCQRYSSKPLRLKTTLPSGEELSSGSELPMNLMFINGKTVLHVTDSATRFSAATFLDLHSESYGQSSDCIWDAFTDIWHSIYTGYPDRLLVDSGSAFMNVKWKTITESRGITLRISGVEAHNSLGIEERYHGQLRRVYKKFEHEFPHVGPALLLRIAVKAINDTMGTNGIVPSLLVFGVVPRFPPMSIDLPKQRDRMATLAAAQMEMSATVSETELLPRWLITYRFQWIEDMKSAKKCLSSARKIFFGRDRCSWYSRKTRL
jgi:hypothetical protein